MNKTVWVYAFQLLSDEFRAFAKAVRKDAEKDNRNLPYQARSDYVERKINMCKEKAK